MSPFLQYIMKAVVQMHNSYNHVAESVLNPGGA